MLVAAVGVVYGDIGTSQVTMPGFVRELRQFDPLDFFLAFGIEQAQFDLSGMGREDREINPGTVPGGSQRIRLTFQNSITPTITA